MLLLCCALGLRAADLRFDFAANPAPAVVAKPVVYSIVVANRSGNLLTNLAIQVELIGDVAIATSSTTQGTATNTLLFVSYLIPFMTNQALVTLTYAGVPVSYGIVTHAVVAGFNGVATQVDAFTSTNIAGTAQLEVAFGQLPGGMVANDRVDYALAVTNRGPDKAVGVVVTQSLPTGVKYVGVSPPGVFGSVNNGQLRLNLGDLESGAGQLLWLSVQPTNVGTFRLQATVSAPGYVNPTPSRSTNETTFTATRALLADLQATVLSEQVFNPQTGLVEQRVGLLNGGSNSVAAARIQVAGLTNQLYNATGTNQNSPFVTYPARLDPGQSVEFVLQYFSPSRQPSPNPELVAFSVPVPSFPAPTGAPISGVRIRPWVDGSSMIEFPAVEGDRYAIRYSASPAFTNAWTIQPSVIAPGSWVQWLDQGPPATLSLPVNSGPRFYRVYHVPTP